MCAATPLAFRGVQEAQGGEAALSLLTRVILIIAAALLPPLSMQVFNEAALRAARRSEVRQEALRDARAVAAETEAVIAGVRNALVATAAVPTLAAPEAASCGPLLQSVFRGLSFLRGIALADDDGQVVCATDPRRVGTRLGTAPEVRLALARGRMALGEFARAGAGGGAYLPAAYPVRGVPGPGPVLVGEIDLAWLGRRLAMRELPPQAAVTLSDRSGTVLVALPDHASVGQRIDASRRALLGATAPSVAMADTAQGPRVIATLPPGRGAPDILVSVSLGTDAAFAAADAAANRSYALIGSGFLVALGLAAWMARGVIGRPVHALLSVTGRWQAGDTAARLPSPDRRSEFGRIAAAVNALLEAVAAGQAGLHERLAELAAIYDGSPVGLGYVGRDLRYVTVNARLAEINAIPAEAHRGRTVRDLLPSVADRVEPLLARALTGEAIPPAEVIAATEAEPGVPRRLLVSYQPAVAANGAVLGVVIAVQEVTALRRAEAALRDALQRANAELEQRVAERTRQFEAEVREREAAQAQLQQAQKMEVIGQLTGGVAHDFNNLLTAIIGNLELATARSQDRPEVARLLTGAMRSADRGAALTQRMLAFGRRQFLRLQPVDVPALLQGMSELLARSIGPAVEVRIETPPAPLRPARADPNQIELVVLNLVLNARDAMPNGGTVTVAAAAEQVGPGLPHPGGLPQGDYVRISVTDTGTGMDEATRARAFEPFFTTKPVGRGSGLGLSMVQGVVAQSDGAVALASSPGAGTTVTVWLPCAEAPAVATPVAAPASPPRPGADRSVLLVDDDPDVAGFATLCLQEAGYTVRQVGSGAEALELLAAGGTPPDLMIADLGMPGMNGLQLAAAARRLHPQLPILIATGYSVQEADTRGTLDLPVLGKPFKAAELLGKVADLLNPVRRSAAASAPAGPARPPRSLADAR